MLWRFTILDRNNVSSILDEPDGWDNNTLEVSRDLNTHGVFFSNQGDEFEFEGLAMQIIKNEYDNYGVEGDLTLILEEDCGNGYEEFYRGKFMFKDYEYICGDACYVKCPLESANEIKEIRARYNQKVDVDSLVSFNGTTALAPYNKLGFDLLLKSKGILLKNEFELTKDFSTPVLGVPEDDSFGSPTQYNSEWGMIEFGFDNQKSAEIGNAGTLLEPIYSCVDTSYGTLGCSSLNKFSFPLPLGNVVAPLDISPVVNYGEDSVNYGQVSDVLDLDINIQGIIQEINCEAQYISFIVATLPIGLAGDKDEDYIYHARQNWGGVLAMNFVYQNPNFVLNKGDRLYIYASIYHRRQNQYSGTNAFTMSFAQGSYIKMQTLSKTPATTSKVYAINETFSRIAEAITDNKLKAYSNYFGRTDSEPYQAAVDGPGGLEVITDGIRIRKQENRIPNKPSLFNVSLQDLFDGLNPIHNIGMSIEPDPIRVGFNQLRIESWEYFYKNVIIFNCDNVDKIVHRANEKEIYSTYQFGYSKWEAEEFTGLDEFLTKRTYRTTLNQLKNDLVKLSKLIASGYALEITRRKGDNNSKDWRYDKDIFIICTKRNQPLTIPADFIAIDRFIVFDAIPNIFIGQQVVISNTVNNNGTFVITDIIETSIIGQTTPGYQIFVAPNSLIFEVGGTATFIFGGLTGQEVELGNIVNANNIIDPQTIYNYRISPFRNALRWMNRIFSSYKKFTAASKIIFSDGDANYYAEGLMLDANNRLENRTIIENEIIDPSLYINQDNAKPFLAAERVVFDYPLNSKQFKDIQANPYGLIGYNNSCENGAGWIESIKYKPEDGLANFILIPKYN